MLQRFGSVFAFEPDAEAANHCTLDAGVECRCGRLPDDIPFEEEPGFDLIVALDVLEHVQPDVESLRSLSRCLAGSGRLLLTVPAYPWLFSGHDRVHHHWRRYTRRSLMRAAEDAQLRVHRCGYFNSVTLAPAVLVRMTAGLTRRSPTRDTRMPGRLANAALGALFGSETGIIRHHGFPAGLSLVLIAGRA